MRKFPRLLLWFFGTAALGGCGSMLTSDQPAEQVYWLEAITLPPGERPAGVLPELFIQVRTLPGLDTDRILVRGPGARLNYYAGARWPDHLPEVMSSLVRLTFESGDQFSRVSSGSPTRRSDWSLDLELREFFAVLSSAGAPPEVHVRLAGHVNCGFGITAVSAATSAPAQEDRLSRIITAFQIATDTALLKLGEQLANRCFGQGPRPGIQTGEQ